MSVVGARAALKVLRIAVRYLPAVHRDVEMDRGVVGEQEFSLT